MTRSEIKRTEVEIENAGHPDDRNRRVAQARAAAMASLEILEAERRSRRDEYLRFTSAWLGEALPLDAPIMTLANEQHQARQYFLGGLIAMAAECGLAWWTFESNWGVAGYIGAAVAAASALVLHSGLALWCEIGVTKKPKDSLRRVCRGALLVGGIGLIIGVVTGLIARLVNAALVLDLLPLLNAGLGITTISLLLMTAALFCAATLYGTSARLARRYHKVDRAYRRTKAFLETLANATMRLLPLLLVATILAGCGHAAPPAATPGARDEDCTVDVIVDGSGSVVGLDEAWRHLRDELPEVMGVYQCGAMTFYRADVNGWSPTFVHTIQLSADTVPQPKGDVGTLPAVLKELERQRRERRAKEFDDKMRQWQSKDILPPQGYESAASDVVGVIQRVSKTYTQRPLLVIYLTDAADTGYRQFPSIAPPAGNVRLLMLLAPANARDNERTTGRPMTAAQQYDYRAAQLKEAAPWVKVAPSYARDIASLLR